MESGAHIHLERDCMILSSFFYFLKNFYFIHMCIQCLGHFSPLPPPPPLHSHPFSPSPAPSLTPPLNLTTWQKLFCPYL
jgi:hypothetical protein